MTQSIDFTAHMKSSRLIARVSLVLVGTITFVLASAIVRGFVPWPEEYGLRAKFDYFASHKDEFDIAYVGSSRVFRSIDPLIVDAGLRERGITARSFNLAVGGMTGFESDHLLKAALSLQPKRLKVIVLEDQPWDASSYFLGNTFSSRSIFWHSPAETWLALKSVFASETTAAKKMALSWTHLRLCAMKSFAIGEGPRIVLDRLGMSRDPLRRALSEDQLSSGAGFQALDELIAGEFADWRKNLLARTDEFTAIVAAIPAQNAAPVDLANYNFAALESQNDAVVDVGARLVRILPPGSEGQPEALELGRRGSFPKLLDYNDPARFPAYFQLDWRFDLHHLNRAGAEDLSRRIAADLAPLMRGAN